MSEDYPPHDSRSRRLTTNDLIKAKERLGSAISAGLEQAADEALRKIRADMDHRMLYGSHPASITVLGMEFDESPRSMTKPIPTGHYTSMIDGNMPCAACHQPLNTHGINVEFNMADAVPAYGGGYAHKLCVIEEAEIVEVKSLPPSTGESHGEASTTAITPDA